MGTPNPHGIESANGFSMNQLFFTVFLRLTPANIGPTISSYIRLILPCHWITDKNGDLAKLILKSGDMPQDWAGKLFDYN